VTGHASVRETMSNNVTTPLLETIEPDDPTEPKSVPFGRINNSDATPARAPVVLTPTNHTTTGDAPTPGELESGQFSMRFGCSSDLTH
jgi:hypothetical protein